MDSAKAAEAGDPRQMDAASPLLLRATQAAALCSTSVRTWRTWDATGKIPQAIHLGRSTFWRHEELRAWIAAGCPDHMLWEAMRGS
jgi:predicted DNA-binding transcriptional regulator AlpA